MDPCECLPNWEYKGVSYGNVTNCSETPDWPGNTWCYVADGANCPSAKESTVNPGMYWDDSCVGACDCSPEWNYLGATYSGCAETPDWQLHDWCFVLDGENCPY